MVTAPRPRITGAGKGEAGHSPKSVFDSDCDDTNAPREEGQLAAGAAGWRSPVKSDNVGGAPVHSDRDAGQDADVADDDPSSQDIAELGDSTSEAQSAPAEGEAGGDAELLLDVAERVSHADSRFCRSLGAEDQGAAQDLYTSALAVAVRKPPQHLLARRSVEVAERRCYLALAMSYLAGGNSKTAEKPVKALLVGGVWDPAALAVLAWAHMLGERWADAVSVLKAISDVARGVVKSGEAKSTAGKFADSFALLDLCAWDVAAVFPQQVRCSSLADLRAFYSWAREELPRRKAAAKEAAKQARRQIAQGLVRGGGGGKGLFSGERADAAALRLRNERAALAAAPGLASVDMQVAEECAGAAHHWHDRRSRRGQVRVALDRAISARLDAAAGDGAIADGAGDGSAGSSAGDMCACAPAFLSSALPAPLGAVRPEPLCAQGYVSEPPPVGAGVGGPTSSAGRADADARARGFRARALRQSARYRQSGLFARQRGENSLFRAGLEHKRLGMLDASDELKDWRLWETEIRNASADHGSSGAAGRPDGGAS